MITATLKENALFPETRVWATNFVNQLFSSPSTSLIGFAMSARNSVIAFIFFLAGCGVLGQRAAEKQMGTHYSAAFINKRTLVVFPFIGMPVSIDLPTSLLAVTAFARDGKMIYGISPLLGAPADLLAIDIKSGRIDSLQNLSGFIHITGFAVNSVGKKAFISATDARNGAGRCGIFSFDLITHEVEHVVNNVEGNCGDVFSSWCYFGLSPDGSRLVATARRGQLGVVNLKERRIERLWPGRVGYWSPNGKWIAAASAEKPEVELMDAGTLSKIRVIGNLSVDNLQWAPDSRHLLFWQGGWECGLKVNFGTLHLLDVETGQRSIISSSKCQVDLQSAGWVSDEVVR